MLSARVEIEREYTFIVVLNRITKRCNLCNIAASNRLCYYVTNSVVCRKQWLEMMLLPNCKYHAPQIETENVFSHKHQKQSFFLMRDEMLEEIMNSMYLSRYDYSM